MGSEIVLSCNVESKWDQGHIASKGEKWTKFGTSGLEPRTATGKMTKQTGLFHGIALEHGSHCVGVGPCKTECMLHRLTIVRFRRALCIILHTMWLFSE